MDRWGQLNLQQKNQLFGIYASKGYTDLVSIINHYNTFQEGGRPENEKDNYTTNGIKTESGTLYPVSDLPADDDRPLPYGLHAARIDLKPVVITAKHPLWDLPDYRGKEDNPNINAHKDELYQNRRRREEAGKEYLKNIGRVGLAIGTLPMLSYGAVAAPLTTGLSLVVGEGLNYGINKLTPYNSWGNMLAEGVFNTDNELAQIALEFTNPGFLLWPKAAPFVNNQYKGLRVANELRKGINSAKLQPKTIENRGLSDSNYGYRRTQNPNSTLDMGEVWRIENDYNNIVNTNNWSLLPSLRDRHFELLSGNAITDNEGNLLNLWHGTPNGHFNMFRQQGGIGRATNIGFYSTPNKNYASRYTAKDIRWGTPSETPAILELYGRGNLVSDRMLGDFPATVLQHTTPEDVLKIRNLGYDGIRSDNLLGKRAEINLFDPSNYKFKAAVTYDDLGNIIPLSKRDNFSNLDMRYKNGGKLK